MTTANVYVELLLTALARGHARSVVLTASERLPDPASLTNDENDLAWLSAEAIDLDGVSAEKVINLLLESAGIRRFHLRKTEGRIRASLVGHDGTSTNFDFEVTKRSDGARVEIEIEPVRA
jgi:hypothetical protein